MSFKLGLDYAECCNYAIMLSVIMLNVVMLSVIMLSDATTKHSLKITYYFTDLAIFVEDVKG